MSDVRFRYVRSLFALGALLGVVSCSGAGSGGSSSIASAVPAAPAASVSTASAAVDVRTGFTADEAAALAAPATEDIPEPVTDASGTGAWGWTLVGGYHGVLKGWTNGSENSGSLRMTVDGSVHSFEGSGVATEYGTGDTLSFTLSGYSVEFYPHGEVVDMTVVDSSGCPATGTAKRWEHVFLGTLQSQGCGFNPVVTTYYFKVHPNS